MNDVEQLIENTKKILSQKSNFEITDDILYDTARELIFRGLAEMISKQLNPGELKAIVDHFKSKKKSKK